MCPEIMAHDECKTPLLVYRILKMRKDLPWQELLLLPKVEEQVRLTTSQTLGTGTF